MKRPTPHKAGTESHGFIMKKPGCRRWSRDLADAAVRVSIHLRP